jgi:hypothetical protein
MKTTDGGNSWSPLNVPDPFSTYEDMSVLNQDTIWLVHFDAVTGGVFRTTTGGASWQTQYQGNNPSHIYMYDRNFGFASSGAGGVLFRTTNSGLNWIPVPGTDGFNDMKFVDGLTGWKANGFMKKTTNGGLNWVQQIMPSGGIILGTAVNKISVLNRDTIWAVGQEAFYGSGQFRGIICRTTNGGQNWLFQVPDTAIHLDIYTQIQFINKNIGWAYRYEGGIHTILGGDPIWLTGIKQISSEIPKQFKLYQNYPNPFNPKTIIRFQIKRLSDVKIKVFDITGKEIMTLVDEEKAVGTYEVDFNGSEYSSGVYFYKLIIDGNGKEAYTETKKMTLVK